MLITGKLQSYILILICILYSANATFRYARYYKAQSHIFMTQESLYSEKARGPKDCSARCLIRKCSCFSFNKLLQQCDTGNCIANNSSTDTSKEYYLLCDSKDGFKPITYGSITACVWESTTKLNYIDARDDCKSKGAHLFTVKSLEKLSFLQDRNKDLIWVGLNDMDAEGTYRWEDDGSVCDEACRVQIFNPGEPNDMNGAEDCMSYVIYFNHKKLTDYSCSLQHLYMCEIP